MVVVGGILIKEVMIPFTGFIPPHGFTTLHVMVFLR